MVEGVEAPWSTARRDPAGMHVTFDVSGPARIVSIIVRLENGGGEFGSDARPGTDYRGWRGLNVKPLGVEGSFTASVEVTDDRGCTAIRRATHGTTVVGGGVNP